ncbi:MAG: ribosomal protein [Gammaproteobacteria bacterium]|jgi:small subunit ribosomal protein S14|nr:ribosomal protein [Gammaproteobacteria bacterium]
MAKKSVVARNKQRQAIVAKYAKRRAELKEQAHSLDAEVRMNALTELQKLPRDASPVRLRNRCEITGRPRGVYRRFGLSRMKLREFAMKGEIPGLLKSSW